MSLQAEVTRSRSPTATAIDLRRLLDRLQHTLLLSPGAERGLRKSSYRRVKVEAVCLFVSFCFLSSAMK